MPRRTIPSPHHASNQEFSDKTVERFQTYSNKAMNHSMGRNARVVKILCYTSLLVGAGGITRASVASVSAAEFQNYKSEAGNQAAHYLPGQLKINSRNLSEFATSSVGKLQIETLFADVEDLPADFNKADTQAEANGKAVGLCAAFKAAVDYVIQHSNNTSLSLDRNTVTRSYNEIWISQARSAFKKALETKAQKYTRPEPRKGTGADYGVILNMEEIGEAAGMSRFHHQQDILRHYIESLATSPRELNEAEFSEFERDWAG